LTDIVKVLGALECRMRRGALVTGHGEDIEALPTEKGRNRLGPPTSLCPVLYSTHFFLGSTRCAQLLYSTNQICDRGF